MAVLLCLVLSLVAALFAFVDVWYFVRGIKLYLGQYLFSKHKIKLTKNEVLSTSCVSGMVLPSDIDMWRHMNNSKYLREMDFGRIKFLHEFIFAALNRLKTTLALSAVSIRYRRSMLLWQRFTIETKVLCWKDDGIYFEQRFVGHNDKFIYAIAMAKMVVRAKGGMSVDVVMENIVGGSFPSPPPPPEVEGWMESISKSSEGLKKERL